MLHKLKFAFKNRTTGSAAKALSENMKSICKGNFSNLYGFIFYFMGGTVSSAYKNRSLLKKLKRQYFDIKNNIYNFNGVRLPSALMVTQRWPSQILENSNVSINLKEIWQKNGQMSRHNIIKS